MNPNPDAGRGVRVAAIFDSGLIMNPKPKLSSNSFENFALLPHPVWTTVHPIFFVIAYRPPGPYSEVFI